jgi:uncharacterized surface protein with fasciclin (FAS1) repeats
MSRVPFSRRARVLAVIPLAGAALACAGDDDGGTVGTAAGDTTTTFVVTEETTGDTLGDPGLGVESRLDRASEALAQGDFSTLARALQLSGLADVIENEQVTLLAPNDDAFAQLSANDLENLLSDLGQLQNALNRHLIDEALTWDQLRERSEVTTVNGDVLPVTVDNGTVTVGGAVVTEPAQNIRDQDITIFAIDRVLL